MSEPILQASGLIAGYVPELPILHGIDVDVYEGQIVTIIGPNGAGKSTLIKAVAGLLEITGGSVTYRGGDITGRAPHELVTSGISYVPQTQNIFSSMSIHQNICLAAHTLGPERKERIANAFEMFPELQPRRGQRASVLSGGQRQMLAMAMSLVTKPGLVMMDEPTAGLAPKIVSEVFNRIRELADSGLTILLVEQNAKAALRISDHVYIFAEGQNQLDGPADKMLSDPAVGEIYLGARRAN